MRVKRRDMIKSRIFVFFAAICLGLALAATAHAAQLKSVHAIAMHGDPKYPANFKHLDYVNPDAPTGGDLHLGKTGSFDTLNNHIIMGNTAEGLELIHDRLMQRVWDEPFTLYGLAAERADISEDRAVVVFHLNPQARFHDGKPMTAADVAFSFNAYKTHGHPVRRRVYGLVEKVDILDDKTIRFSFGAGYDRESVMILALMPVLPKHYWESDGRDIGKTTLTPPLGSGPYKIRSVDPGRKIVYEKVPDYWAKDLPVNRGLYNFETITHSYFRDDDVSLQSFGAGAYDLRREFDIAKWKTGYNSRAMQDGRILREEIKHGRPEALRAMVMNTRNPLFADIRVRRAMNGLFDDEWINKNLYFGALNRIDSIFANAELAAQGVPAGREAEILARHRAELGEGVFESVPFPPITGDMRSRRRQATQLFHDAGFFYRNQKLTDTNGRNVAFEILTNNSADEKIALSYVQSLRRAGIDARVRTVDSAQFIRRLETFDFDMVFYTWINSLSPGNEQLNYWGSAAAHSTGSRNYAGISSPAVDDIASGIARADTREGLVAHARALDRVLMRGEYMIPLFYTGRDLVAYDRRLKRPPVVPVYGIVLESWWRE